MPGAVRLNFPPLQDYVSAWTIKFRQDGMILKLRQKYVDDVSPSICETSGSDDSENAALDLKSMAGTFVFSGTLMTIGMVIFAVGEIRRQLGHGGQAEEDAPDDGDEMGEENDAAATGQHSGTHKTGHRLGHAGEQGSATMGDRTARKLRYRKPYHTRTYPTYPTYHTMQYHAIPQHTARDSSFSFEVFAMACDLTRGSLAFILGQVSMQSCRQRFPSSNEPSAARTSS